MAQASKETLHVADGPASLLEGRSGARHIWLPLLAASAASTAVVLLRWFLTRRDPSVLTQLHQQKPAHSAADKIENEEIVEVPTVCVMGEDADNSCTESVPDLSSTTAEIHLSEQVVAAMPVSAPLPPAPVVVASVGVQQETEQHEIGLDHHNPATQAPATTSEEKISAAAHTYDHGYSRWDKLDVEGMLEATGDDTGSQPEAPFVENALVEPVSLPAQEECAEVVDPKCDERDNEIARQVLDHLEQQVANGSELADESEWLNHVVQNRIKCFSDKVETKRIERLLTGDTVQLDKLGLDCFDARIVGSCLFDRNRKAAFVNLNGNTGIGPKGTEHLACLLRQPHPRLNALFLSGCRLGDAGLALLAKALPGHSSLEILEVRHNSASDLTAHAFAEALGSNDSLESLYLNNDAWVTDESRNLITDEGAWALAFAMVDRKAVFKVRLGCNLVSSEAQEKIKDVLGRKMLF